MGSKAVRSARVRSVRQGTATSPTAHRRKIQAARHTPQPSLPSRKWPRKCTQPALFHPETQVRDRKEYRRESEAQSTRGHSRPTRHARSQRPSGPLQRRWPRDRARVLGRPAPMRHRQRGRSETTTPQEWRARDHRKRFYCRPSRTTAARDTSRCTSTAPDIVGNRISLKPIPHCDRPINRPQTVLGQFIQSKFHARHKRTAECR